MRGELIRRKLRQGGRVYGTHIVSLGNPVDARMRAALEMDFVFICTEHMPLDRTEVSMMCQFYAAHGIAPIVRIPYPEPHWACMALDAGAHGIVAPYVETVAEVRELVGAVRYRPIKGEFLRALLEGRRQPNAKLRAFFKRFNRDRFLIIGVESAAAIERLEELLADDGVDGVFLGPHDITCSLEVPEEYEHPVFVRAVTDAIRRTRRLGRGVGIHLDQTAPVCRPFLKAGVNLILHAADVSLMRNRVNRDFQALRQRFGDVYTPGAGAADGAAQCIAPRLQRMPSHKPRRQH
jgi:4-hydroxy-2-oxoheptanedioate aldolase